MEDANDKAGLNRRAALLAMGGMSAGALAAQAAAARAQDLPEGAPGASALVNSATWSSKLYQEAEDYFVIDGVAHCYNHSAINMRTKSATKGLDVSSAYHDWSTPARYRLTAHQYNRDWQPEEVMDVMFLESATDMIVMHSVPLYANYWDGLVSNEKGAYLKGQYPNRVLWYGAVDVFQPLDVIKARVDQLVFQGADGIKIYPYQVNPNTKVIENWLLDDEKVAFPVCEYLRSKGVKHLAVHKLVGYSAEKTPGLGINDFYKAAAQFPDLTFHIVHGGWLMLDETAELMRQRENVTAVLEGPMLWPHYNMAAYDKMWSVFIPKVDINRIIYASTSPNQHPYWIINDFVAYKGPPGITISREQKAKILGGNLARYHGIDVAKQKALIADDRFARHKKAHGYREPYVMQRAV